jgi:indolepyruvate decarboxylase
MNKILLGDYLLTRLKEAGIDKLIGVPGDFNLAFLEQVLAFPGIDWVGACNELNAAYTADGYARQKGCAALAVTYGVGDLSALNGIAGAYAEHVPLIVLSGVPPLHAIRNRESVHHTAGTGAFEDVMTCMAQFTAAQARITPANAAIEIDRLVRSALREKLPVYMQLPSDISYLEIEAPTSPLVARPYSGDSRQNAKVVDLIAERILRAQRPALLVDADTHRFGLRPMICALGEHAALPFASMSSGRSIFNEQHPLYRGIYAGRASAPETIETIEGSDCLITIGVRFFDATTGYFSHQIPTPDTIQIDAYSATIDGEVYEGITAAEVLVQLRERLPRHAEALPIPQVEPPTRNSAAIQDLTVEKLVEEKTIAQYDTCSNGGISHAFLWRQIAAFLREKDVILAENGTSLAGISSVRLPADTTFISQNVWGSIGYTLPALLGSMLARPELRHLLFIGDGSLQMTAQEISTLVRHGLKPVIFVLNNHGYTIERVILGPQSGYNEIQNWNYAGLPQLFSDGAPTVSYKVRTEAELQTALRQVEIPEVLTLIEIELPPLDAPLGLRRMGPQVADYDFGERGPQERINAGLRGPEFS